MYDPNIIMIRVLEDSYFRKTIGAIYSSLFELVEKSTRPRRGVPTYYVNIRTFYYCKAGRVDENNILDI